MEAYLHFPAAMKLNKIFWEKQWFFKQSDHVADLSRLRLNGSILFKSWFLATSYLYGLVSKWKSKGVTGFCKMVKLKTFAYIVSTISAYSALLDKQYYTMVFTGFRSFNSTFQNLSLPHIKLLVQMQPCFLYYKCSCYKLWRNIFASICPYSGKYQPFNYNH